jgi:hypothetical protein
MAYTVTNFKTKKALREALEVEDQGVYQPGGIFPLDTSRGRVAVEGPHYPAAHSWYADVPVAVTEYGTAYIPKGSKIK